MPPKKTLTYRKRHIALKVNLSREEYSSVQHKAKKLGVTMSRLARAALRDWGMIEVEEADRYA